MKKNETEMGEMDKIFVEGVVQYRLRPDLNSIDEINSLQRIP